MSAVHVAIEELFAGSDEGEKVEVRAMYDEGNNYILTLSSVLTIITAICSGGTSRMIMPCSSALLWTG
jgi:hypothetical protein